MRIDRGDRANRLTPSAGPGRGGVARRGDEVAVAADLVGPGSTVNVTECNHCPIAPMGGLHSVRLCPVYRAAAAGEGILWRAHHRISHATNASAASPTRSRSRPRLRQLPLIMFDDALATARHLSAPYSGRCRADCMSPHPRRPSPVTTPRGDSEVICGRGFVQCLAARDDLRQGGGTGTVTARPEGTQFFRRVQQQPPRRESSATGHVRRPTHRSRGRGERMAGQRQRST
jgi:hypothetical protein